MNKRQTGGAFGVACEEAGGVLGAGFLLRRMKILEAAMASIGDCVIVCDAEGRLVLLNPAAARVLGPGEPGLPHERWSDHFGLFLPDGVTPYPIDENPLVLAARGRPQDDAEAVIRNALVPQGIIAKGSARPVRDEMGVLIGAVVVFRDVTAQKLAERAQRELSESRARSNTALDLFATTVSHDLQGPLRKIIAYAYLLRERVREGADPRTLDGLGRIRDSAQRMSEIVVELLEYARAEREGCALVVVPLDRVFAEALLDLEWLSRETEARVEIDAPLPSIPCNPAQLRQVARNLLANAFKFHRPGQPPVVRVRARDVPERRVVEVEVSDQGIGFDAATAATLFDCPPRGIAPDQGYGLGLAICRRIVERHGGSLAARGEPGAGAVFTVVLPSDVSLSGRVL